MAGSMALVLGAPRKGSHAVGWEAIGCATGADGGRIGGLRDWAVHAKPQPP